MKSIQAAIAAILITQSLCGGAIVSVDMGTGAYNLRDHAGTPLTVGNAGTNGDGALVFLGFYTDGTTAAPFGSSDTNFVKLSGVGNIFGTQNTTIGDTVGNGAAAGQFFFSGLQINDTNPNAASLPAAGTPLVVRILDRATEAASTYKMEFANTDLWTWVSPTPLVPSINIDLDDAGLRSLNPTGRTNTPISGGGNLNANVQIVPEPSLFALQGLGVLCSLLVRVRRGRG